eukprot:202498_1
MTPITRPGGNAVFWRGPQNNAGVHCPSHKSLKLERGGDIGEIHAANELCSCDISDVGSSSRDVGKKGLRIKAAAFSCLFAASILWPIAAGASTGTLVTAPSVAGEHLHLGQKVANFFHKGGLPDWTTLMLISAMPVVELRGGVPVGLWMGLPVARTLCLCIAGNMLPIPIILLGLRSQLVRRALRPMLERASKVAKEFGGEDQQALALALFVGIPLPGTGAWTGAMAASLLSMPVRKHSLFVNLGGFAQILTPLLKQALMCILAGVVSSGIIMTTLTLAG